MTLAIYLTVEGNKQSKFKGDGSPAKQADKIAVLSLEYSVQAPRDLTSGITSGKRMHKPVVVVKEWSAATPQFFQALVSNETLKSVLIEFVRPAGGKEEPFFTIRLTDATVSEVRYYTEDTAPGGAQERETVSFTFREIVIEHVPTHTDGTDSWSAHP